MPEKRASYEKFGRGRRISPELKQTVMQRLKAGAKSTELEREFRLSYFTVAKYRRLLGDYDTRRGRKMKLSPEVLQQAEQRLRAGDGWRHVAADLRVSPQTLYDRLKYRKRANR
jgi:transposase